MIVNDRKMVEDLKLSAGDVVDVPRMLGVVCKPAIL